MGGCCISKNNPVKDSEKDSPLPKDIHIYPSLFVIQQSTKFLDMYKLHKRLGGGTYGEVHICVHIMSSRVAAVKILIKSAMEERDRALFFNEIQVLKSMDHPNIIRLLEVYEDFRRFYMVTELYTGGELFGNFEEGNAISERSAATYMKQILSAITYCHSKGIVHRDLKPGNMLLESDGKDALVKVIDFGTAKISEPGKKMTKLIGTPFFMAPEVLTNSYDEKCDVWSCGVIMYILLCGTPPFPGRQEADIFQKIKMGKYNMSGPKWSSISLSAKELVNKMLTGDPSKRCSAKEALLHPWIKDNTYKSHLENISRCMLTELSRFRVQYKLQEAVLIYLVSQWTTSKEKEKMQLAFIELDEDKDGRLSKEDLVSGFRQIMGEGFPAEDEANKVMRNIDIGNNGYIEYSEFVMATIDKNKLLTRERLATAFHMFDRDENGVISYDEIRNILGVGCNIADEKWKELVKDADENGDGVISPEEFIKMMRKLLQ